MCADTVCTQLSGLELSHGLGLELFRNFFELKLFGRIRPQLLGSLRLEFLALVGVYCLVVEYGSVKTGLYVTLFLFEIATTTWPMLRHGSFHF